MRPLGTTTSAVERASYVCSPSPSWNHLLLLLTLGRVTLQNIVTKHAKITLLSMNDGDAVLSITRPVQRADPPREGGRERTLPSGGE